VVKKIKIFYFLTLLICSSLSFAENIQFIALGDLPYNLPRDEHKYQKLINEINKQNHRFSIFLGDTKSGSSPCSNEYLIKVFNQFNSFNQPLIYTPGDNEWTDCHRINAGAYDPTERLDFIRDLYFKLPQSLGMKKISLQRQSEIFPEFKKFVENSYWIESNYIFATVHIVGSNNNFQNSLEKNKEFLERNAANNAWITYIFNLANKNLFSGIIFAYHADMFFHQPQTKDPEVGFKETLRLLTREAELFKKPVLLINGDSHTLKIDQPLLNDKKNVLENVYRLQVMGAEQIQAVEITIDPRKNSPFIFRPISTAQD